MALSSHTLTGALKVRHSARSNTLTTPTTGLALGHIQANLIVLPQSCAADFELLCARNPVPCPLLGKSSVPGDPHSFEPSNLFAHSDTPSKVVDIRTDIAHYNIYQSGKLLETKSDIISEWTDSSVAFLIGCSFSFESALTSTGLQPRQIQQSCNVPMYKTSVKLHPAGIFTDATMVVSMRPYLPQDIERVRDVTRPFVKTHGEPVAWGWDAVRDLGIESIERPDFGDAVRFEEDEIPVFWGCGVTPQVAVMAAAEKIPGKVMGHSPGHMLVLDITEEELFASEQTKTQRPGARVNGSLDV